MAVKSWLQLPRLPEPEIMDDPEEVEAYASAAAQAHLSRLDASFVEHAWQLVRQWPTGRGLDVGCGPGQILLQLAERLPGWEWIGVDRSPTMIGCAEQRLRQHGKSSSARVILLVADGNCLPFADGVFDLVVCNSVLHHLEHPERVLAEMARVLRPAGAFLLRDLRRPSRLVFPWHVRWHGRHYTGRMYALFRASVRAAYTEEELQELIARTALAAQVARFGGAHLVAVRAGGLAGAPATASHALR